MVKRLAVGLMAFSCVAAGVCLAAEATDALFPALEDVAPPVLVPRDLGVRVDGNGNYLLFGRPRFLIGAQVPEPVEASAAPTAGYHSSLKWLYEWPLDYEAAQRLGFDTASHFTPLGWIGEMFGPDALSHWHRSNEGALDRYVAGIRLPLYVDFTCSPWLHGTLYDTDLIPPEARNAGGYGMPLNHWVPYSATQEEGRRLYRAMWAYGARHALEHGGRPLFYELFNEPAYDDPSRHNRRLFAGFMRDRYGTIERLNAAWRTDYASFEEIAGFASRTDDPGLCVDWCKFMEDAFADLCREGVAAIREVDRRPEAGFCVQVMGGDLYRALPKSNVNLYKLSRFLNVTSTCTGGGVRGASGLSSPPERAVLAPSVNPALIEGILHRHFIRSISRGKPIHDGEAYVGHSKESLKNMLWLELARVADAAYLFKWGKRAWDPLWGEDKSPEGGRLLAEKFPYLILNPYAVPTEALTGIMEFKREMLAVADLFCPRAARQKARVALLLSFPTERYAYAVGDPLKDVILNYAAALEFSHVPFDVILEEQLHEGRQAEYGVIVAAAAKNSYDETLPFLARYVAEGGVLVLGLEALEQDEHGNLREGDFPGLVLGERASGGVEPLRLELPLPARLTGPLKAKAHRRFRTGGPWEVLGRLDGGPAVVRRAHGEGRVYYLGAHMADYGLAALLGAVLQAEGIPPACRLTRADESDLAVNVELHHASADGLGGWFLYNWDRYPKIVRFEADELEAEGIGAADPFDGLRHRVTDGGVTVLLAPHRRKVLVSGPPDRLAERFGELRTVSRDELARQAAALRPLEREPISFEENVERRPIYEDVLPAAWEAAEWGGAHLEQVETPTFGGSSRALKLALDERATAWCGVVIRAAGEPDAPHGGPAFEAAMRRDGFLSFYVNGSADEWGAHRGEQRLQVNVRFSAAGGEWQSGPYIGMGQYVGGGVVDDDPATWQRVRIPLRRLIGGAEAGRIGGVSFQYRGAPPAAALFVDSVALEVENRPPGF
jgi:hypothetical protein